MTTYHENVLQSYRHKQLNTQLQEYTEVSCRRGNLVAQNTRKTFSPPLGELTALHQLQAPGCPISNYPCYRPFGPRFSCSLTPKLCFSVIPSWCRLATPLNVILAATETCVFLYIGRRLLFLHSSAWSGFMGYISTVVKCVVCVYAVCAVLH